MMNSDKLKLLLLQVEHTTTTEELEFVPLNEELSKNLIHVFGRHNGACGSNDSCNNNGECCGNTCCDGNGTCNHNSSCDLDRIMM